MTTTDRRPVMDPESALGFLAQASGVLAGSLDLEHTLSEVAGLAVPDVADWCAVDIVEPDGSLRQVTSRHPDPEQEALLLELRRRYREEKQESAGAKRAIATGEALLAEDAGVAEIPLTESEQRLYERLGPRSYMIVPLLARGRTLGALTLLSTREGRHYTAADLDFAQHLGRRFALAIDNARLYDEAERSRGVLDTLFRSVPVGVAYLDAELRCVRANAALGEVTGRSWEDCIGCPIDSLLGDDDHELERLCRRVLELGEPMPDRELSKRDRHWVVTAAPVKAGDGATIGVGLVTIDVTERRAAHRRSEFLARVGAVLESSLDYATTLRNVAQAAVPDVADWCTVHIDDDIDGLRLVGAAHTDPAKVRLAWELDSRFPISAEAPRGPAAVLRTGATEVTESVDDAVLREVSESEELFELLRGLGLRASVVAPLRARGRILGAITVVLAESGRTFADEDVALVEELARRAALAVDNARLYTERSRIAHTLQSQLLPSRLPEIPGLELAVRYRAAGELNEVGGDFYDVFARPDGEWAVLIGDVSGKGAEAAAVTALARHTLRTATLSPASPSEALAVLNEAMLAQRGGSEFCTVCIARLSATGSGVKLAMALGGHPPAYVVRADGRVEAHGAPGTLIGIFPDPKVAEVEVELGPGDMMLLYTDGVTDSGPPGDELGEAGLVRVLELLGGGRGADEIVAAVEQAAVDSQRNHPRDDIALVALRVEG